MTALAYIALGSNLGDRHAHLAMALESLATLERSRIVGASRIEETAPIGPPGQEPYLNQMVALETTLSPHELLDRLQAIETRAGRVRDVRWGSRTLDLDIVTMGDLALHDARVTIPHPELPNRDWWQRELAELRGEIA